MTRCDACNGVIKRSDLECYTCGTAVPGASKPFWRRKRESEAKPAAPVTPVSNLLFIASLMLTAFSFLSPQKLPLAVTATLSVVLFSARLLTDRKAATKQKRVRATAPPVQIPRGLLERITLG
jgi:hypothetical protein